MNLSPVLFFHICAGTSGLFSGAAALSFRKGSRWHVLAGRVFVGSMLAMAAGAVYLAIVKHQPNNIGGGIFTFYLILTAWLTARRADGETSGKPGRQYQVERKNAAANIVWLVLYDRQVHRASGHGQHGPNEDSARQGMPPGAFTEID